MAGTHALTVTLRMLGARVGHHVHVHHGVDLSRGGWHLLTLGDRVSLARDVSLRTIEFDDGHLVIGPIAVDDGATLDVHAGVGPGAHVGREASLPRGPRSAPAAASRMASGGKACRRNRRAAPRPCRCPIGPGPWARGRTRRR